MIISEKRQNLVKWLTTILLVLGFLVAFNNCSREVNAQTRNLPKAGFPVLAAPNSSDAQSNASDTGIPSLPYQGAMHLSPGLDRQKNAATEPYNPGEPDENMALVRWQPKNMPLLIWISPGLKLPDCPLSELKATRVDTVTGMLQTQDNPFAGLEQSPTWKAEMNDQVAAGIEQWRQFQDEQLFSFAFTDNPHNAHICVFFTDAFRDGSQPGGINIGGNTSAQIYPIDLARKINIKQKPVIIELSTLVNDTPEKMMGAAAHEFGHALGIKAHSPYREDLMYADRIVDHLSEADKATIRWLYKQSAQFVM